MFRGATKVTLDAKGRMAIPTRYRPSIQDGCEGRLVVTVDRDYCLLLYPLPVWEELERRLVKLPSLKRKARNLQRLMLGYATDVELDGQSRILVSKELREVASISRVAMMVGQGNKFELWDEGLWTARRDQWLEDSQDDDAELPEELATLSL
ncbi:MAG: division/cell wall cluster transcriptional repressor MraZ [Pseudomonadota bacterium]